MEKVLTEHIDVHDGSGPEVGWISFIWGDEKLGLRHMMDGRQFGIGSTRSFSRDASRDRAGNDGFAYLEYGQIRRNIASANVTVVPI